MALEEEFNYTNDYEFSFTDPLFPPDLFTHAQLLQGGIALHILGSLVMFIALFINNNLLLVPSLGAMLKELKITPASSTTFILAAEKSLPKLMIAFISCFMAFSDIGVASLIGASTFNIMIALPCCAIAAKQVIVLPLPSLLRNVLFFIIVLILLLLFSLDYQIEWWEAILQLILMAGYSTIAIVSKFVCSSRKTGQHVANDAERLELKGQEDNNDKSTTNSGNSSDGNYVLAGIPSKILNLLGKLCVISLPVSLAIMFAICYFLVWWSTVTGDTIGIPPEVMAIIFITPGTGLASLVTSMLMTRQGHGVSAVNSCLSSSIFDLTIGFAVPAIFFRIIKGQTLYMSSEIVCNSALLMIVISVLIFILILACRGRVFKPLIICTLPLNLIFVCIFLLFSYAVIPTILN